jgi:uncharacterized Tic20 family protein
MRGMATAPQTAPLPTEDEKSMAMISYILSIFFGWLAPLIIWLVKRDSKFISFHALQMLFWHGIFLALTMVGMVVFFIGMFATIATAPVAKNAAPPTAFFILMPLLILLFWGGWLVNLIIAIVFAIKAKNGEWTRLPLVGNWARRAVGLTAG